MIWMTYYFCQDSEVAST